MGDGDGLVHTSVMKTVQNWHRYTGRLFDPGRMVHQRPIGAAIIPHRFSRQDRGAELRLKEYPLASWIIRPYDDPDQQEVVRLHQTGAIYSELDPSDPASDLDNIREAYFMDPRNHFWVAQGEDQALIGMVAVMHAGPGVAEIRRLRVDAQWRETDLPAALIRKALLHCRRHGFLKVVFDTHFESQATLRLFDKHGFLHTRSKRIRGKDVLEFYLNLYQRIDAETPEKRAFA